ncbi:FAD:protein FMN transferase [Actimicrobium sp. CCC2.4]|uniref:FAD:protein FMN transferase n=1 Tax=Actimicrobium sp. CCC2.4 TaxID=3048606 RepID=UPI002AC9CE01|nr:FAD:protein FMN transferase [Actimicrobium sp. CCC2.4]MEB0136685.1 FAD:protein FMN transferase [Actimicrobium sp. CCC2.4]WPX33150.1 FAD:protein FMN transferase [Actimicrobium sp. CCC2.4]
MKCRAQPWLGTLVDIRIGDVLDAGPLNAAFTAAFSRISEVHRLMSFHDAGSDVARLNRAAVGSTVAIDAHTACVIRLALQLHAGSDAIFNISCATRLVHWEYLPSPGRALPAYDANDCGLLLAADGHVHKTRDVLIDLGGIAKGYAVDQAIAVLQQAGVTSACVNAGGDVRVLGATPFAIAIRDPSTVTGSTVTVDLANAALATSATYFSAGEIGGRAVSALVDGRSGEPINSRRSVTVQAADCLHADALTKIVMASGDATHPLLARHRAQAFIL